MAIGLVFLTAAPASAHNTVVSTDPADGSTITIAPERISITTNEPLLDVTDTAAIEVAGPDGLYYSNGCVYIDGPTASTDAVLGEPGTYTVQWRLASEDGHPISDSFSFTWAPGPDEPVADGSPEPLECGQGPSEGLGSTEPATPLASSDTGAVTATATPTDGAELVAESPAAIAAWIWAGAAVVAIAVIAAVWQLIRRRRKG